MGKPRNSLQVCFLCHRKANPGSGVTEAQGRRHKVCPPMPTKVFGKRFAPSKTQALGILSEEQTDAVPRDN